MVNRALYLGVLGNVSTAFDRTIDGRFDMMYLSIVGNNIHHGFGFVKGFFDLKVLSSLT
jgi:hypothetical protein